jgi:N-acyl-D-amino-acid deacylase
LKSSLRHAGKGFFVLKVGMSLYDLVIANGRIVDGTGEPGYRGDVGITNGEIVTIGDLNASQALERLDAEGLVVSPGFIDIH